MENTKIDDDGKSLKAELEAMKTSKLIDIMEGPKTDPPLHIHNIGGGMSLSSIKEAIIQSNGCK